jgi:hypothetical protein
MIFSPPRYVVAAVHAGCRHLDQIVARAIERAAADDQQIIFLTIITARPLSTELTRIRMQLHRYGIPIHLVATWIDASDLSPAQRHRQVAAELARGAEELGAAALVLGLDPQTDVSASNVASHVATMLAPRTDLCFGISATSDDVSQIDDVLLTPTH